MPPQTRWFIRTSFIYFILALAAGVWLGVQSFSSLNLPAINLSPVYIHLLTEGWITMLIIGVAYWMFPKFTLAKPRRNEPLAWWCYGLLNTGLVLRILSEPVVGLGGSTVPVWSILLVVAAILQWMGGMAFVINTWGRVKEK